MTKREQTLLAGVLGIVGLWGAWSGWQRFQDAQSERQSRLDTARQAVADAQLEQSKAQATLRQLETWQAESLPTDIDQAQSEYRAWLIAQGEATGLTLDDVKLAGSQSRGEAYTAISYSAEAQGDLTQLTKFLHRFYSAGALHKLTKLQITPLAGGQQLKAALGIEALSVRGATRGEGMPEAVPLASGDEAKYVSELSSRNLFAKYVPPAPPKPPEPKVVRKAPPPPPKFDDAEHAYLTGIVQDQAWIHIRTRDETLRLKAGDKLKVGLLEGDIVSVDQRAITYRTSEGTFSVSLGQPIRPGAAISKGAGASDAG
jgi:hypothetical protein